MADERRPRGDKVVRRRPSAQKREPERIEGLLRGLRAGMSRKSAAIRVGLAPSTVAKWCDEKEHERDPSLRELSEKIRAAEMECQLTLLDMVQQTPNTSLALLGRKWPAEFGKAREEPETQQQISVDKLLVLVQGAERDGSYDNVFAAIGIGSNGSNGQNGGPGGAGEEGAD